MREEMMHCAHASHGGMGACLRRMRECMTANMNERVSACQICLSHADNPTKEPIIQYDVGETPWAKIGVDLCDLHGTTLMVVTDYYSNFVCVKRLHSTTTAALTEAFMELFSCHGLPETTAEFKAFTAQHDIDHTTSSPHYPQSNGKAENAVKIVKRVFAKCRESGRSEHLALLDLNNTPAEGVGLSPAQRLFGRRCRTSLPISRRNLRPRHSTEHESRAMRKRKLANYYNRSNRPLSELCLP